MKRDVKKFSLSLLSKYRNEIYGFSILWIMLFHSYLCEITWNSVFRVIKIGNMGCEIFLLLSGISLYFAFAKVDNLLQFYQRRLMRALIPTWLISAVYWIYEFASGQCAFRDLILRFTTLNFWVTGNQQIWFICLIILSYLLYPMLNQIIFRDDNTRKQILRTIVICVIEVITVLIIRSVMPALYSNSEIALTRMPVFTCGVFFGKHVFEKRELSKWIPLLSLICTVISFLILSNVSMPGIIRRYFYIFGGVPLTFLLARIFEITDRIHLSGINRILRFFGGMTIELYLVHIIVITLYRTSAFGIYTEGKKSSYLILLCVCVGIAYIASRIDRVILKRLMP